MNRHLTLASLVVIGSVLRIFAAASVVVVPDEATAVEKFAAAELADELGKCLGYRPIVICERASRKGPMLYIGATKAAKAAREELNFQRPYKKDEVFLKSVPYGVVLDGDPARGPIFAAEEWVQSQDWTGKEEPCAVQVALERLRRESGK